MTNFSTYDLVVGLGRSGLSMARFLKSLGNNVLATDIDASRTREAAALEALGIQTRIGSHDQDDFAQADTIILSPGIPLTLPYIKKATAKGVRITGELDIFTQYNTTPIIAVSGSNGKTTTTELIGKMVEASGLSCFVGGNIGTPLVEYLMDGTRADLVVAEVSSFQLDLAKKFKPRIGVLLNISPDHLDRYLDYKAYRNSKWSLFANQDERDTAVINAGIQNFHNKISGLNSKVVQFFPRIREQDAEIQILAKVKDTILAKAMAALPGGHNKENIEAAALAVLAAGGTLSGIARALENVTPLAHRIAPAGKIMGIRFFNDSKATNTDAVIRAIQAFDAPIILILGGREKDTNFTELIPGMATTVKAVMAMGEAKNHIQKALEATCPVTLCQDMAQAVNRAYETAVYGEIVLLSPACASFDMYKNYQARGNDFISQVNRLKTEAVHGTS